MAYSQTPPHFLHVDDDVYVELWDLERVEQTVAASIEAMFIYLGESQLSILQDPVSFDKLAELTINHFNTILGTNISTRRLDVETPPSFAASTRKLFKLQWPHKKNGFCYMTWKTNRKVRSHQ